MYDNFDKNIRIQQNSFLTEMKKLIYFGLAAPLRARIAFKLLSRNELLGKNIKEICCQTNGKY